MNVKKITPEDFTGPASPEQDNDGDLVIFLAISQLLRRAVMKTALMVGRITLTITSAGRRHGPARINGGPEGDRTARVAVPEPASRAGHRRGVPFRGVLRRPRRGAGQVRDGAPCHGGRGAGHRHRSGVRVLPAVVLPGRRRAGRVRPGRAGAGQARAPRRPQAHRRDPHLGRAAAGSRSRAPARQPGRAHRRRVRGARAPPVGRARWPAAGSATPKAADLPARENRKEEHPSLPLLTSPGPAAADPGIRPDAGQARVPGGGLDTRYEQLRHAALHARASAFPLGLGVLTAKGITAWRRALAALAPAAGPGSTQTPPDAAAATRPQALPPEPVTTELIHALAGLAVALAGT